MSHASISVWLVCKLCRGSFGQVDEFIEHKREKHLTDFQNTSCIIFEEREYLSKSSPVVTNEDHQLSDETNNKELAIKIELNDDVPIIPVSSEIIHEPNGGLFEPKSELVIYKSEIFPQNENNFFDLKQPVQNPYVLLKRLTFEDIQSDCVPKHHSTLLKCEQEILANSLQELPNSFDVGGSNIDHTELIKTENQPTDENVDLPIKTEVNDDGPIIPFSSEIVDEPSLGFLELKSELFTFESEITPKTEHNFFGLLQQEQNPYVLLKRLTSEKIQVACIPQNHSRLLNFEQTIFTNDSEPPNLPDVDSTKMEMDHTEGEKSIEIQPTAAVRNVSIEHDLQFQCKLCSKQLESDRHLRIHVRICALYHKDRNRYCFTCNKKFSYQIGLKRHYLDYHGAEEEKLSLYKKCHLCPKWYQSAVDLECHLEFHILGKKQQVKTSKQIPLRCSQPNCGKEFLTNNKLHAHIATHFGLRPFSCSTCNKAFTQIDSLKRHLLIHTGERPYKCKVDKCNKTFISSSDRSRHHQTTHRNSKKYCYLGSSVKK